jgi:type VI secretion system protein ImpK
MSEHPEDGGDEPTVVGYRPVRGERRPPQTAPPGAPMPGERSFEPSRSDRSVAPDPVIHLSDTSSASRFERAAAAERSAAAPPPGAADAVMNELVTVDQPKDAEDLLAAAAAPLLALAAELRDAVTNADVDALRRAIVEQIKAFEARALRFGARAGDVTAARYVLCAMLDEAVMTTPWGNASAWSAHSLLNQFHGETWGGEKVFVILERVKADPAKYLALIKLIDLCLAFGFEGRYRVIEGGRYQIDELREDLARILRAHLKPPTDVLSAHSAGVRVRRRLRNYAPLWIVFSVVGVLLLALYGFLGWQLTRDIGPATAALDSLAPLPSTPLGSSVDIPPVRSVLPQGN